MAVPKKKTSKSKRNMRRSHLAIKPVNVVVDSVTGEYKLPHHISLKDGTYNGKQVIESNDNEADEETEEATS